MTNVRKEVSARKKWVPQEKKNGENRSVADHWRKMRQGKAKRGKNAENGVDRKKLLMQRVRIMWTIQLQ